MTRGIFLMAGESGLVEMKEREYDSEAILQGILARFPTLLLDEGEASDGKKLLLIKREMEVPSDFDEYSRWSADHLFISHDGVPIIVEVKRRTDTRIRREVVGQMLDYAANGIVYWPVENLRKCFQENCERDGVDAQERMAEFLGDRYDEATFWENVKTNLQAGKIRMVFVADVIPKELKRIVEFLNVQMDPAEVIAIEVRQYTDGEHKALVPRFIGRTEEASGRKSIARGPATNEQDFKAILSENAREFYDAMLALDCEDDLSVIWRSSGFSLNVSVGGRNVPICWGYNKDSGPGESTYVKFDKMEIVQGSEELVNRYRKPLLEVSCVRPCGSNKEVKVVFDEKVTAQQTRQIVDIFLALSKEIQSNGMK